VAINTGVVISYSVADMRFGEFIQCEFQQRAYFSLPVVGIAVSYGVDGPGIESRWGSSLLYSGY
jgi:hypothetical protein